MVVVAAVEHSYRGMCRIVAVLEESFDNCKRLQF